jgi:hypothetical protein
MQNRHFCQVGPQGFGLLRELTNLQPTYIKKKPTQITADARNMLHYSTYIPYIFAKSLHLQV